MEKNLNEISFKGEKVLITGGCGFIGSHLAKRLLAEGAELFILDRKDYNPWRIKNEENLIKILGADISDTQEVNDIIKSIQPDYIFHLAAYGVDSAQKAYITALNTNALGIINVLSALKVSGCKKLINMGSCAEYGDKKEKLVEDMCLQPISIYGSTKACSTILAHQIALEKHIDIVTLRPFGIFGEGEERHKIFSHVILTILEGRDVDLTLCKQCRDYCYVENIIDGLVLAAKNDAVKNEIFNIGSGVSHPLKYYIDMIFEQFNTDKKPRYGAIEYRNNEMWDPVPDISKIKSQLGWEPKISLEDGIIKTIEWYKENWLVKEYGKHII